MSELSDEATILIVNSLPFEEPGSRHPPRSAVRNDKVPARVAHVGRSGKMDRGAAPCSMIIYNVRWRFRRRSQAPEADQGTEGARRRSAAGDPVRQRQSRRDPLGARRQDTRLLVCWHQRSAGTAGPLRLFSRAGRTFRDRPAETAQLHSPEWNVASTSLTCSVHNPGHQRRRRRQRRGHGHGEYQSHGKTEIRA